MGGAGVVQYIEFSMRRLIILGVVALAVISGASFLASQNAKAANLTSTSYQVLGTTMVGGGGYTTSTDYSVLGVISEFAHDVTNSASYISNPGFAAFPSLSVSTPVVSATPSNTSVGLSWTASSGGSGYAVGQSAVSGGPYSFTSVGNALSYTASSLSNSVPYYFVVDVLNNLGGSIATSSEVTATPESQQSQQSSGGGSSGGGSIITSPTLGTTVTVSGLAYPSGNIFLLKDGQVISSTVANANSQFTFSVSNLSTGSYILSVYGVDSAGNQSSLLSFPVTVTTGFPTNVTGLFISPTINVDNSEVLHGNTVTIFGQTVASSTVTLSLYSGSEILFNTVSDKHGAYSYSLDTSALSLGSPLVKAKASFAGQSSDFGTSVSFIIGDQNIAKNQTQQSQYDLNGDGRVNLIDFSIMVYWFGREPLTGTGLRADFNHDGKVDIVDFSILAAHWTG